MPISRKPHADAVASRLAVADKLCAERGRRLTPIRRTVLELMLRRGRSLKAYELLEEMRATHPGSAPPTVYRALEFLVAEGLIHRLDAINAWTACQHAEGKPHDLLVVCTCCGTVAELSDPEINRLLAERIGHTGYVLATHETEIRALCPQCQRQPHAHPFAAPPH